MTKRTTRPPEPESDEIDVSLILLAEMLLRASESYAEAALHTQAEAMARESYGCFKQCDDQQGVFRALLLLASAVLNQDRSKEAEIFVGQALIQAEQNGIRVVDVCNAGCEIVRPLDLVYSDKA